MKRKNGQNGLKKTVIHVNRLLYNNASENEEFKGNGHDTGSDAYYMDVLVLYLHIGDSRVYAINKEEFRQMTRDHSYVNVLLIVAKLLKKRRQYIPSEIGL